MNKEFVTYEQALTLKKLGFNEPCLSYYEGESFSHHLAIIGKDDYITPAPLYQQAFRWFREKYGFLSYVDMDNYSFYRYTIYKGRGISDAPHETYEEAESACIDKLIEIVKSK